MLKPKYFIVWLIRAFGILGLVEWLRFIKETKWSIAAKENKEFVKSHPDFPLPPMNVAYDAYGGIDWEYYYNSGIETSQKIGSIILKYCNEKRYKVLEWGCGPAFVIRHMHKTLGCNAEIFGSDYNTATIRWCKSAIHGVSFIENKLAPPLPLESDMFHFVYVLSVFTHLSEKNCMLWIRELRRVLKPGGVLIFTTKGESLIERLMPHEKKMIMEGRPVARGKVKEGKRVFDTFHPSSYVKDIMLDGFEILEYTPHGLENYKQNLWVVRKNK